MQILCKEGDTVKAGTQLARVAVGEAGATSDAPKKEAAPAPPVKEEEKSAPPLPPKTATASSASPNKDAPSPPKQSSPEPAQPKSISGTEVHMPTKGGERRVSPCDIITHATVWMYACRGYLFMVV